jgi:hypothetical protein
MQKGYAKPVPKPTGWDAVKAPENYVQPPGLPKMPPELGSWF